MSKKKFKEILVIKKKMTNKIEYLEVYDANKACSILRNKDLYQLGVDDLGRDRSKLLLEYVMTSEIKEGVGYRKVSYVYGRGKRSGRMYAVGSLSLQNFGKSLRHTISKDFFDDIDIVNCHPVLLKHICEENNFQHDYLLEYINNRDNIIKDLMDINLNLTRDDIKDAILSLLNGGQSAFNKLKKTQFIIALANELKNILIQFSKLNKKKFSAHIPKNDYNKEGSYINTHFCDIENEILQEMVKFFKIGKGKQCVLVFDGFMVSKGSITEESLRLCEEHIYKTLNYKISLLIKPMTLDFQVNNVEHIKNLEYFKMSLMTNLKTTMEALGFPNEEIDFYFGDFEHCDVADFMYYKYGEDFKNVNGLFYSWSGVYWIKSDDDTSIKLTIWRKLSKDIISLNESVINKIKNDKIASADDTLLAMLDISSIKTKRCARECKNDSYLRSISNCFKLLIKSDDIFDLNPNLLGFTNGTYDLKNSQFRESKKEDYISLIINYDYKNYEDNLEIKELIEIIKYILPEDDEYEFMMKVLSTCLYAQTLEQIIVAVGNGRNGKDTLLTYLLKETLGPNLFYYNSSTTFTNNPSSNSGADQSIANMDKKRCIVYNEPNTNCTLKCNRIKEITGGKTVNARALYSKNTITTLHGTHILLCNTIPSLDIIDEAISQRMIVIPFRAMFRKPEDIALMPENKYVKTIDSYYKTQDFINKYKLPFLHILLKYFKKFKEDGYLLKNIPLSIKNESKAYLSESDHFFGWFDEMYEQTSNPKDIIKMSEIFRDFTSSSYFMNLTARGKRAMTRKVLLSKITENPNLKHLFIKESNSKSHTRNFLTNLKRRDLDTDEVKEAKEVDPRLIGTGFD